MGGGSYVGEYGYEGFAGAISSTTKEFPLDPQGRFGVIGRSGRNPNNRQIASDDPRATFESFRSRITYGSRPRNDSRVGNGDTYVFPDGSRVTARIESSGRSGGSPVIQIWSNSSQLTGYQRIHFEEGSG